MAIHLRRYWTIGCFEEGPLLRMWGPLWWATCSPGQIGDFDNCWTRFLRSMGEPDTEASRRKYRKRGYRRVEVELSLSLCDNSVPATPSRGDA
jgi:hypothetical protein